MTTREAKGGKRSNRVWIGLAALTLLFSMAAWTPFTQANQLLEVKVDKQGDFSQVVITTKTPGQQPKIYRNMSPISIFVDFENTKLAKGVPGQMNVNSGGITEIKINKVTENKAEMARVEIYLDRMMVYEVNPVDKRLLITIKLPEQTAQTSSGDLYAASPGKLIVEKSGTGTGAVATEENLAATAAPGYAASPTEAIGKIGSKLLDIVVDEQKDQTSINFVLDGAAGDYKSFEIQNPPRVVLDLLKVSSIYPGLQVMVNSQGISKIRIGKHADKVRLVVDASGPRLPSYNVSRSGDRLVLAFSQTTDISGPNAPMLVAPIVEPAPKTTGKKVSPPRAEAPSDGRQTKVLAVDFKYNPQNSTVIIKTSDTANFEKRENPEDLVYSLVLKNARIPSEQERSLDITEFASPINLVGSFQANDSEVNVVVNLNTWTAPSVKQEGSKIELVFANPGAGAMVPSNNPSTATQPEEITAPPAQAAAPSISGSAAAMPSSGGKPVKVETLTGTKVYTGSPIKIDAKNLDLLDALRAIAEVSGLNIIASDDVKGKITLKLDNVPWDQALDLILETKGLGLVQYGNVIRVAPIKEIQKEREDVIKNLKQQENLRPIQTRIIPLNFAKVNDIQPQIKSILTERGSVDVDKRTNALIIKDIPEKIQEAQILISSLDIQTPQVLIEARILEASLGVTRELGVQWGVNYNNGPAWGNGTGVNFPNNMQIGGAVLGGLINPVDPKNLNAASAQGGAVGISLGSLTDSVSLDLLLKSLETQNKVKIISSPRIMTMDNQRATITQGVTIPYPPAVNLAQGAGGTQWQFVEAALRLEVTPHISPDGSIALEVKVSNNEPNQKVVSGGSPSIDKKEADTTVIVKDGQTIVIGGIYKTNDSETINETPYLSKIPILGKLFQDKLTSSSRNELLIFLTPRIIK